MKKYLSFFRAVSSPGSTRTTPTPLSHDQALKNEIAGEFSRVRASFVDLDKELVEALTEAKDKVTGHMSPPLATRDDQGRYVALEIINELKEKFNMPQQFAQLERMVGKNIAFLDSQAARQTPTPTPTTGW